MPLRSALSHTQVGCLGWLISSLRKLALEAGNDGAEVFLQVPQPSLKDTPIGLPIYPIIKMEAAGQPIQPFRAGPDYAFIHYRSGCGAFIPIFILGILVPTHPPTYQRTSRSMSLYRASLRLALFLPLGVTRTHSLTTCH
jgi:hypothetical protein